MDVRDLLIRTLIGEAGNQGDAGKAAVAHVIRNRLASGKYGPDVQSVIMAPKQFSVWNPGDRAGETARRVSPADPVYQRASAIADSVFGGQTPDPTRGATHYFNPAVVQPSWGGSLQGATQIGDHVFGAAAGGAPQTAAQVAQRFAMRPGPDYAPVSNDETGVDLREYFEGNAQALGYMKPETSRLFLKFLNDNPYGVGITSADRDTTKQAKLYADFKANGGAPVAAPGRSQHNHGNALDLSYEDDNARKWALQNAKNYGLHFPVAGEDWHVEPVEARGKGMVLPDAAANAGRPAQPGLMDFNSSGPQSILGGGFPAPRPDDTISSLLSGLMKGGPASGGAKSAQSTDSVAVPPAITDFGAMLANLARQGMTSFGADTYRRATAPRMPTDEESPFALS